MKKTILLVLLFGVTVGKAQVHEHKLSIGDFEFLIDDQWSVFKNITADDIQAILLNKTDTIYLEFKGRSGYRLFKEIELKEYIRSVYGDIYKNGKLKSKGVEKAKGFYYYRKKGKGLLIFYSKNVRSIANVVSVLNEVEIVARN